MTALPIYVSHDLTSNNHDMKRNLGKIAIQCSFGVNIFASAILSAGMFDIFEH